MIITVTESDLAARSGLSWETVSREMSKLHERGYADGTSNGIVVTAITALEQALGSEI